MLTVTFIRHGQSEDNVREVWAGWKDAPLSALGQRQARVLGESLDQTPFTHIYCSDLLRAHHTGKVVHERQPDPKPPLTVTKLVREQHFGVAEGYQWMIDVPEGITREELYQKGIYPVLEHRYEKYANGESLNDLATRAEAALRECVFPHLDAGAHIAIASHGLCISEMVSALMRLDPEADKSISYQGLLNTAWTRVNIQQRADSTSFSLTVTVTHVNHASHLFGLESEDDESDGKDSKARAFFGGATDNITSITNANVEVTPICEE